MIFLSSGFPPSHYINADYILYQGTLNKHGPTHAPWRLFPDEKKPKSQDCTLSCIGLGQ